MSRSVELVCVDPAQVSVVWPQAAHWIRRAMERGDLGTFESVQSSVLSGDSLLWLMWQEPRIVGAGVTELVQTERSNVCQIVACGGERLSAWLHLIGRIEDYAAAEGCDCVRILGRKGWARVLKNYRTEKIVLERRL